MTYFKTIIFIILSISNLAFAGLFEQTKLNLDCDLSNKKTLSLALNNCKINKNKIEKDTLENYFCDYVESINTNYFLYNYTPLWTLEKADTFNQYSSLNLCSDLREEKRKIKELKNEQKVNSYSFDFISFFASFAPLILLEKKLNQWFPKVEDSIDDKDLKKEKD